MNALLRRITERPLRLVAATVVVAVAGSFALTADAAPPGAGDGGPMGMMAAGPMGMMAGPGRHLDRMLDSVNASADQRAQIKAIFDAARTDLKALHDAAAPLHDQGMKLFTAPTVDARAAEALRQQMLAQHDKASQRMMQAMLDVSRVLTPEQRQQIADAMARRRAAMQQRWHGAAPATK